MNSLDDEAKDELFEIAIVFGLNLIFLVLITLLLWPLGRVPVSFSLAKGYALFWLAVIASILLLLLIGRILRIDLYSHYNAYVSLNLAASVMLIGGWSAFAALTLRSAAAGAPVWLAAILYVIGFFSCYIAFAVLTSVYRGTIYKLASLLLGFTSYLLFALWPAAGRALYGWVFTLFGMGQ